MTTTLAVLGAGRVGTAMAALLRDHFEQVDIIVRSRDARVDAWALEARVRVRLGSELPPDWQPAAVLVCVADASIVAAVAALAPSLRNHQDVCWIHTAGSLPGEVMRRVVCGPCGSMHPLFPFGPALGELPSLRGVAFAVDGDAAAKSLACQLVQHLGGLPIDVAPEARVAWHLAAVLASNGVYALLAAAAGVLRAASIDPTATSASLASLAAASASSAAARGNVIAATGPVVRGDANTVERHRDWIRQHDPQLDVLYRELAERLVEVAEQRGLNDRDLARLSAALYAQRG